MDNLVALYPLLRTVWVVWFFLLFVGMLAWVFRPGTRAEYQTCAAIPLRDEPAPRGRSH